VSQPTVPAALEAAIAAHEGPGDPGSSANAFLLTDWLTREEYTFDSVDAAKAHALATLTAP
jgi:hypothetical protein